MAVLSEDDLINRVANYVGDRTDEDSMSIIEDISDTIKSITTQAEMDRKEAAAQYDALNESWSRRYKERFKTGIDRPFETRENEERERDRRIGFDDIFPTIDK